MTIDFYSKEQCVQCTATKRQMDKKEIQYNYKHALEESNYSFIKGLGHQQAPVVVVRDSDGNVVDHWSGHRPDRVNGLTLV